MLPIHGKRKRLKFVLKKNVWLVRREPLIQTPGTARRLFAPINYLLAKIETYAQ